jgi:AcrR family transcriptional regulator
VAIAKASTRRGRARRAQLLNATARLVADRGFHAVGIADIGAAAGVSGAAIYRHFATKTDLLVALLDQVVDELLERSDTAIGSTDDPTVALYALVAAHLSFALRDRAIIAVYDQRIHDLPPDDRRRIRRAQRIYVERWTVVLRAARPELPDEHARARVQATFGLLNSVSDFPSGLGDDELAEVLTAMALAGLLTP